MKTWASLLLLAMILWSAPQTYTNGMAVPAAKQAQIIYHLFVDGVEFATVPNGLTTWTGNLPQVVGEVKSYTATAELDGTTSAPTDPYVFAWYVPLSKPGAITIQLSP
jgi:hypothetical protein